MKAIFWNLGRLGLPKSQADFHTAFGSAFDQSIVGNSIGDFVVRVVVGDPMWPLYYTGPADVFVMVELMSPGVQGAPGGGDCITVLQELSWGLTAVANNPGYDYDFVPPVVIANKTTNEVIGIVFNRRVLTLETSGILNPALGTFHSAPFGAAFRMTPTGTVNPAAPLINIIGIHAPTSSTTRPNGYQDAGTFSNELALLPLVSTIPPPVPGEDTLIGGDFNCGFDENYVDAYGNARNAFHDISQPATGYTVAFQLGELTSLVRKWQINSAGSYLCNPYDNIICRQPTLAAGHPVNARVLDLIQEFNPLAGYGLTQIFRAVKKVSDHLPVEIEW